jgi:hypothetical protein
MKTTNLILILIAVMSLMACGQLHVVTLYVDTTNITYDSIDKYANFDQPKGIANKDFTTHVRKGDRIIWEAVSISDPPEEVQIDSIYHISGERIFESKLSKVYPKSFRTKPVFVKELFAGAIQMKPKPSRQGAYILEKYGIEFTVAKKEGPFTIDPVLKAY